jgi:hypothetical protein
MSTDSHDLSYYSVWGKHGHAFRHSIFFTFIENNRTNDSARASANHARGNGAFCPRGFQLKQFSQSTISKIQLKRLP